MAAPWYRWKKNALIVQIRLHPHANCNEVVGPGPQGAQLKIRITAPPVEGKANAHLIHLLAKTFQVRKNQVRLLSGAASRDKRVCIENPAKLLPGMESCPRSTP